MKLITNPLEALEKVTNALDEWDRLVAEGKKIKDMERVMEEVEPTTEEVLQSLEIVDDLAMLSSEIATVRDRIKEENKTDEFNDIFIVLTRAMVEIDMVQKK